MKPAFTPLIHQREYLGAMKKIPALLGLINFEGYAQALGYGYTYCPC